VTFVYYIQHGCPERITHWPLQTFYSSSRILKKKCESVGTARLVDGQPSTIKFRPRDSCCPAAVAAATAVGVTMAVPHKLKKYRPAVVHRRRNWAASFDARLHHMIVTNKQQRCCHNLIYCTVDRSIDMNATAYGPHLLQQEAFSEPDDP
jgi:hypothetical protein